MDSLIIFIKNPVLGKVKTRLAATVGNDKALEIYNQLLRHTRHTTQPLPVDKHLFYSDFIDLEDKWADDIFNKHLQSTTNNLGQKMFDAFWLLHNKHYEKVVIIGSDCLELNIEILREAYMSLDEAETILGPAKDGGYYAIGFNFKTIQNNEKVLREVFLNKTWSNKNVANEAFKSLQKMDLKTHILPELNDVDSEEDAINLL